MRSIAPGDADSNPAGAVYHGSLEGGKGAGVSFVGRARDDAATMLKDNKRVQFIFDQIERQCEKKLKIF